MKLGLRVIGLIASLVALLSAIQFYQNYWRLRGSFNSEGRYFDPVSSVVYHEQAGIAWGAMCLLSLSAAFLILLKTR